MRWQPIDEKYFADKEETEEEKAARQQVVKKRSCMKCLIFMIL